MAQVEYIADGQLYIVVVESNISACGWSVDDVGD